MNGNSINKEHLRDIKTSFKVWSIESFYKELPFYEKLGIFSKNNNLKLPSSYEDFINNLIKGNGLKNFLLALGQKTISSDYELKGNNEKSEEFSLGFKENSFFNVIVSTNFYEKFFLEKGEQHFKQFFRKTFDEWFEKLNWEKFSLAVRIGDSEEIKKLLLEQEKEEEENITEEIAIKIGSELINSLSELEQNSEEPKNKKTFLKGTIKDKTLVTKTNKKKEEVEYDGWIISPADETGSKTEVEVYRAGNNYYIHNNTSYILKRYNKEVLREKMFNYAMGKGKTGKSELIDFSKIYDDYKKSIEKELQTDEEKIIKTFEDGVEKALEQVEITYSKSFRNWWDNSGKENFRKMLDSDSVKEEIKAMLIKVTTSNKLKGNLGEIFCGILATIATQQKASILGGVTTKQGTQHATDLMIAFENAKNNLEALGAQIKTFPSAEEKGEQVFYSQSNQIGDDSINRYLNPRENGKMKGNEILKILIKEYFRHENSYNSLEKFLFSKTENYLRYREGNPVKEGTEEIVRNIKNNFYIFNFRIIPASLIFYFLGESLEIKNISNIFYFSEKKEDDGEQKHSKTQVKSLKESLENIFSPLKSLNSYDSAYLNFAGVTIRFKGITGKNLVNFNI